MGHSSKQNWEEGRVYGCNPGGEGRQARHVTLVEEGDKPEVEDDKPVM